MRAKSLVFGLRRVRIAAPGQIIQQALITALVCRLFLAAVAIEDTLERLESAPLRKPALAMGLDVLLAVPDTLFLRANGIVQACQKALVVFPLCRVHLTHALRLLRVVDAVGIELPQPVLFFLQAALRVSRRFALGAFLGRCKRNEFLEFRGPSPHVIRSDRALRRWRRARRRGFGDPAGSLRCRLAACDAGA